MRICVAGGGVIGLTCAYVLAAEGYDVSLVARDIGIRSASRVATAIWHVYYVKVDDENVLKWSSRTLRRLIEIADLQQEAGVQLVDGVELFRNSEPHVPIWANIPPKFALLDATALAFYQSVDPQISWGYSISAPCADMKLYLPWLQRDAEEFGVKFQIREIEALSDLANDFDLIVNCTGFNSRELANDTNLRPVKGQYVVYGKQSHFPAGYIGDDHHPDGTAYVIIRNNQVIIGGTEEEGVEDLTFTIGADRLIERSAQFSPWLKELDRTKPLEKVVGLRPFRPEGIRFGLDFNICETPVLHNYGHGGSGFSLSWGCANSVLEIVRSTFLKD